jgi:hypothetical protein
MCHACRRIVDVDLAKTSEQGMGDIPLIDLRWR